MCVCVRVSDRSSKQTTTNLQCQEISLHVLLRADRLIFSVLAFVSSVFYSFSHTQPMMEGVIKLTEMVHQSESNIRITEIIRHRKDKKKFICIKMLISLFTGWVPLTKQAV